MPSAEALHEAIGSLQQVDPAALSEQKLGELVCAVDAELARLTSLHARLAAAVEARAVHVADGSKSAAAWLARRCRRSKAACASALRLGRALRSMPETDAAVRAGEIRVEHVRELALCRRVAEKAFATYEETLVEHAMTMCYDDFVRVCAYWRQVHDPDGSERSARRRYQRRHLFLNQTLDGSWVLNGMLDPIAGAIVSEAIGRIEAELFELDWRAANGERPRDPSRLRACDLMRTGAQRRADALVELARRAFAAPAGGRKPDPLVTVLIDYETFVGRVCELSNGTVVTPGQVLPVLTDADIERVVFGPRSRVLDVGERSRFFTGATRRSVVVRDRRCQWPGCDAPADHCEIDHVDEAGKGGPTVQDNGRPLCRYHHRLRSKGVDPPPDDVDFDAESRRRCRERVRQLRAPPAAA